MKKVAVDRGLPRELEELLEREGYQVVGPYRGQDVDAIVTTGMDENFLSIQDIRDTALVIDASGKTPEEILRRIEETDLS